jgi:ArsR family transcriptional regulator, zinc-responsive transcriptional repressor
VEPRPDRTGGGTAATAHPRPDGGALVEQAAAEGAAALLKALAHPGRVRIIGELADGDRCVHELVDALEMAQPTVSQHLQVLRSARLVSSTRVGKEQRYTLRDHHVHHIVADALTHAAELD